MGYADNSIIGKYQLGRTIGEGNFGKVKVAVNTETGQSVAIKIIDKTMVIENKLMDQVKREISTMKLLHHPNIVRIYEVIATKKKIFLVMEYISGGQLSDKMSYTKRLNENEARKYFQQLIDAIDYCHSRGVYHRDLKPENLLLDVKGNLKVSDFGLSGLRKPGDLLSTTCGSPSYVAPEVIANKSYDGSASDIWSCGVVLFELLAGYLPFEDRSITSLYRKISTADYTCPDWFTEGQRKLISRILEPQPTKRITVAEIIEDKWFNIDYRPSTGIDMEEEIDMYDLMGFDSAGDKDKQRIRLGSKHSIHETIEKIAVAAKDVQLSVERMNNSKVKLHASRMLTRCRSHLAAEVIEVTPTHCVVEVSKSAGELGVYTESMDSWTDAIPAQRIQS
ncbi:CBL-interacting serine/threonine-protein kinase 21 [Asimina triloba]